MSLSTEQEIINIVFPNDNTKTINDVIQILVDGKLGTIEQVKTILKSSNPSITDWSF